MICKNDFLAFHHLWKVLIRLLHLLLKLNQIISGLLLLNEKRIYFGERTGNIIFLLDIVKMKSFQCLLILFY